MEYKEFENYINKLKASSDRLDNISRVTDCDIFMEIADPLTDMIIDLLEDYFDDDFGWISFFIFDLEFGKHYKPGVELRTIKDLYEIIK